MPPPRPPRRTHPDAHDRAAALRSAGRCGFAVGYLLVVPLLFLIGYGIRRMFGWAERPLPAFDREAPSPFRPARLSVEERRRMDEEFEPVLSFS